MCSCTLQLPESDLELNLLYHQLQPGGSLQSGSNNGTPGRTSDAHSRPSSRSGSRRASQAENHSSDATASAAAAALGRPSSSSFSLSMSGPAATSLYGDLFRWYDRNKSGALETEELQVGLVWFVSEGWLGSQGRMALQQLSQPTKAGPAPAASPLPLGEHIAPLPRRVLRKKAWPCAAALLFPYAALSPPPRAVLCRVVQAALKDLGMLDGKKPEEVPEVMWSYMRMADAAAANHGEGIGFDAFCKFYETLVMAKARQQLRFKLGLQVEGACVRGCCRACVYGALLGVLGQCVSTTYVSALGGGINS